MKLYAISGLGADERVFQYLTLDYELIPVQWIKPKQNEGISPYAARLAKKIDESEPFGLIAVSFGGLVAVEISKILSPEVTILISSAETKHELPKIYRIIGKSNLIRLVPHQLFNPPRKVASWVFGTTNHALLKNILDDTDLKFTKWAINELTNWSNEEGLANHKLKIGGTNDKLIPPRGKLTLIEGGGHFMIVDKALEISEVINQCLKTWKSKDR
ncbi:MAG: alpha/beta hydrolase [Bacteroidota bacterium]